MVYHHFWGSHVATVAFKYLTQSVATLLVLLRFRPRRVIVMSPPIVACLPVWLYAKVFGAHYAIDAHTATFIDHRWRKLDFLARFLTRAARTTLVTDPHWKRIIEAWSARCDIVTDVRVEFPAPAPLPLPHGDKIAVVCTYTFDEPVETIFRAASLVPEVSFHFTGSWKRLPPEIRATKPDNVHLMGFLPDAQYVTLLTTCTAVMSLTVLDHTMQRGAYEAAYLGRPIVTSNFELLRRSFPTATVFVDNTPESIASGIRTICADSERYRAEATRLREFKRRGWNDARRRLQAVLD
jgi:glycosyltransferase involved in cell wall biosynthesis